MNYICDICSLKFDTKQHLIQHKNKKNKCNKITSFQCNKCNKYFKQKKTMVLHIQKCNKKIINQIPIKTLENNYPLNNQLINIIIDKSKTIENLKTEVKNKADIILNNIIESPCDNEDDYLNFIFNKKLIRYRNKDNYLDANQLCNTFNKNFNEWYNLDNTKILISDYSIENNIIISELIQINKNIWIHPDFAIQLAYWISPKLCIQITRLIRTQIIKINKLDNNLKDYKIQLLEDSYIKKQKRKNYPDKNVIYIITTENNKKNRNYIIGKAFDLKNRLSTYNKTTEHEVIYYRSCNNESTMNIVENIILNKLNLYREKANRDRFILPIDKEISFFINIVDSCINFIL